MNLLFLKHLRPLIPKQVLTGFSVPAQHRWDLNDSNWGVCTSDFNISLPEHHPNPYIIHATQTKMSILHILWIWKTLLSPRFGRWWFKLQLVSGSQLNQLNLWFKLLDFPWIWAPRGAAVHRHAQRQYQSRRPVEWQNRSSGTIDFF